MLAQLNSKQKSLFFNIKPTVIDKLISKNKSSIQNSLLYTNEDSDGSLSEDSEESSSSSQDSNIESSVQQSVTMAPVKRSEKTVFGSRVSSKSQFPIKRGPGRPSKAKVGKNIQNLKVVTAKKVIENSKKCSAEMVRREVQSIIKEKRNACHIKKKLKCLHTVIKKENPPEISLSNVIEPVKTTKRKTKIIKKANQELFQNQSLPEISQNVSTNTLPLLNIQSSPRKFPSNVMDLWKSTGMVIRGRGRPRGSTKKSFRGGIRKGLLRSERYNTRDSLTGVMRSGKRRKCSDSSFIEGLDGINKKKRKEIKRIKKEKSDSSSEKNSSSVIKSEVSFSDNENSIKDSDENNFSTGSIKIKVESSETGDDVGPRDTNSNVFKNDTIVKTHIKTSKSNVNNNNNSQSNISQSIHPKLDLGPGKCRRGRKRLFSPGSKLAQCGSSTKDSDCSLDSSDVTEECIKYPKQELKRYKRKVVGGLWVRRSTRSIEKNADKTEPDAVVIEELLKEGDNSINSDSVSKSSLNNEDAIKNDIPIKLDVVDTCEHNENIVKARSDKALISSFSSLSSCIESNTLTNFDPVNNFFYKSEVEFDSSSAVEDANNDSLVDFTLALEESPIKSPIESALSSPEIIEATPLASSLATIVSKKPTLVNDHSHTSFDQTESQDNGLEIRNVLINKESNTLNLLELCDSQSNNHNVVTDKIVKNDKGDQTSIGFDHKENNDSNESASTKDECMDAMFEEIDKKLRKQGYSDKELISDKNILSLIDSEGCQSYSANASVNEKNKASSGIGNELKLTQSSFGPPNRIILSVEYEAGNKCLEQLSCTDYMTSLDNNLIVDNLVTVTRPTVKQKTMDANMDHIYKSNVKYSDQEETAFKEMCQKQ